MSVRDLKLDIRDAAAYARVLKEELSGVQSAADSLRSITSQSQAPPGSIGPPALQTHRIQAGGPDGGADVGSVFNDAPITEPGGGSQVLAFNLMQRYQWRDPSTLPGGLRLAHAPGNAGPSPYARSRDAGPYFPTGSGSPIHTAPQVTQGEAMIVQQLQQINQTLNSGATLGSLVRSAR